MKYITVLAFSLITGTAYASSFDGNKLYELCQSNDFALYGYVSGWIDKELEDSYGVQRAIERIPDNPAMSTLKFVVDGNICYPKGMTLGQAKDVLCLYLKNNPATRAQSGSLLLWTAYREVWTCAK